MHYIIKQLKDLKTSNYSFEWWEWAKDKFNINDYKTVYEGDLNGTNPYDVLEKLFYKFNVQCPIDFKGHSLSVSDVVELDGINYYCDSTGWVKLEV